MTLLSTILSFFPALVMFAAIASFLWLCFSPGIYSIIALILSVYGFPLATYKIHNYFYPLKEGISYLQGTEYSPWWGSHQIQNIYITFPALEAALRLIPGAFSLWLRLWGSKVGEGIYWTPKIEIADRGLLEIGDRVVFGHGCGILSHAVKPKKQNLLLYVKKVKIGNYAFIGAGSYLGPGVVIEDQEFVPVNSHLYPNKLVNNEETENK